MNFCLPRVNSVIIIKNKSCPYSRYLLVIQYLVSELDDVTLLVYECSILFSLTVKVLRDFAFFFTFLMFLKEISFYRYVQFLFLPMLPHFYYLPRTTSHNMYQLDMTFTGKSETCKRIWDLTTLCLSVTGAVVVALRSSIDLKL